MLESVSALRHFRIHAADGDIGHLADVFFDDQTWTARYFVVETGGWLRSRRVLISPVAVTAIGERARTVTVDLTRDQIAGSPAVDTDMPLSRQMELKYRDYFAWPLYWVDTYFDANSRSLHPRLAAADQAVGTGRRHRRESVMPHPPRSDPHLRSAARITGYAVIAADGPAGRLDDFVIDTDAWRVRTLVVHLDHVHERRTVWLPVEVVREMDWPMSVVRLSASREEIHHAPAVEPARS